MSKKIKIAHNKFCPICGLKIEKCNGHKEHGSKRILWITGLSFAFIFIVVFSWMKFHTTPEELHWTRKKAISSSENIYRFIKAVVAEYTPKIPFDIPMMLPFGPRLPIRKRLELLSAHDLEQYQQIVLEAKAMLGKGNPLHIIFIGDEHAGIRRYGVIQTDKSLNLQPLITEQVRTLKPQIAFVEGYDFCRLDREGIKQQLATMIKKTRGITPSPTDLDAIVNDQKLKLWWKSFVDQTIPKLYGIDYSELQMLILDLQEYIRVSNSEAAMVLFYMLNNLWREQLIIAAMVKAMRIENVDYGVLVLGSLHIESLPDLCKQWGIDCEVKHLP